VSQADRVATAIIMAVEAGAVVVLIQYLFFGMYSRKRK
jgi:hypothetical protein